VLAPLVAEMGEGIRRVVDAHRLTAVIARVDAVREREAFRMPSSPRA
jgi:hypothetical protein